MAVSGGVSAVKVGAALAGLTATVKGPALASGLTPFEAVTEKVKVVVPIGGVPVTAPVVGSMDRKAGAPSASE